MLYNGVHLQRKKRFTLSRTPLMIQLGITLTVISRLIGPNLSITRKRLLSKRSRKGRAWRSERLEKSITVLLVAILPKL